MTMILQIIIYTLRQEFAFNVVLPIFYIVVKMMGM